MQRTHQTTNQDDYCGLFANEYVQRRSLPAQSECPTFVMRHRSTSSDHKGAHVSAPSSTALPASSAQRRISEPSSMHRSYPSPSGRSNAKPPIVTKRPSSSSCYKPRSTTSISPPSPPYIKYFFMFLPWIMLHYLTFLYRLPVWLYQLVLLEPVVAAVLLQLGYVSATTSHDGLPTNCR